MRSLQRLASVWRTTALATTILVTTWASGASALAQDVADLTIPLNEYEGSGVSGSATLSPDGETTGVAMELSGDRLTGDHPTHIHVGTCDDFDPDPTYPLTTVILDEVSEAGLSETEVDDVSLPELLDDDHVILVHKSAEELTTYFVCGDIKRGAETETETEDETGAGGAAEAEVEVVDEAGAAGTDGTSRLPSSGTGLAAGNVGPALPGVAAALAALAAASLAGLLLTRRRRA